MLGALHSRLAGVVIECLSYGEFLARYDRPGTLFYLDPPCWGSEGDYGRALFSRDDFGHLAAQLRGLSGRFIMSVNDVSEIRAIFAGFEMEAVETTYTVAKKAGVRAAELIIEGG